MQGTRHDSVKLVLPLLIQAGAGMALLLTSWLLVFLLPMVRDVSLPVPFTLGELLAAAALTGIVLLLVNFGARIELRLAYAGHFHGSGTIFKVLAFLLATITAYYAYRPLLAPCLGDRGWIYSLVFLVLTLAFLAQLGYLLYVNMERVGLSLTARPRLPHRPPGAACPACGTVGGAGHDFCTSCGAKLERSPAPAVCGQCGGGLKPGARFCRSCGKPVGPAAPEEKARTDGCPEDPVVACPACGTTLPEGAAFCTACGVRLG